MILFTVPHLASDELIIKPPISQRFLSLITWSILSFKPGPKQLQFSENPLIITLFLIVSTPTLTLM